MTALRTEEDHPHVAFHDPRLSDAQNKAAEMALNGFTIAEIADEMDTSRVVVSSLLHYARKKGVDVWAKKSARAGWSSADLLRMRERGLSYAQISERTGINDNTVGVRIHQERKRRGISVADQIVWPEAVKLDWLRRSKAGESWAQIAASAGVSRATVGNVLTRLQRKQKGASK